MEKGRKEKQEFLDSLIKKLEVKFVNMAVIMDRYEFTRENYELLFPNSKISTPIGEVKMGGHQFEKLEIKKRKELLGAMYQTLIDPVIIIKKDEKNKETYLYIKTFKDDTNKINGVQSVVANISGTKVSISTHRKDINNLLNKIKKATDLIYQKPDSSRTAGNDP